mmetsp:Transcript_29664/g.95824  ORF Transcript_29664/g.95824 Transcript_29664/m.95824 type:complete len:355 (-) Transcript_29664:1512-2576(-)
MATIAHEYDFSSYILIHSSSPCSRRTTSTYARLDAHVHAVHGIEGVVAIGRLRAELVDAVVGVEHPLGLRRRPACPAQARARGDVKLFGELDTEHTGEFVCPADERHAGADPLAVGAQVQEDGVDGHVVDAEEDEGDSERGDGDGGGRVGDVIQLRLVGLVLVHVEYADAGAAGGDDELAEQQEERGDEADGGGARQVGGQQPHRLVGRGAEGSLGHHHLGVGVAGERLERALHAGEAAGDAAAAEPRERIGAAAARRLQPVRDVLAEGGAQQEEAEADHLERGDEEGTECHRARVVSQHVPQGHEHARAAAAAVGARAVVPPVGVPLGHGSADGGVLHVPHKHGGPKSGQDGD